jgi:hypothetical protein
VHNIPKYFSLRTRPSETEKKTPLPTTNNPFPQILRPQCHKSHVSPPRGALGTRVRCTLKCSLSERSLDCLARVNCPTMRRLRNYGVGQQQSPLAWQELDEELPSHMSETRSTTAHCTMRRREVEVPDDGQESGQHPGDTIALIVCSHGQRESRLLLLPKGERSAAPATMCSRRTPQF